MTDQPFQPATTDPTQAQTPSQGGVFGGFVGVEDAPTSKIPDASVLFGNSSETIPPVQETPVQEVVNFSDLNLSQDTSVVEETMPVIQEFPSVEQIKEVDFSHEVAPIEADPVVEESTPIVEGTPITTELEEAGVAPIEAEPIVEESTPIVEEVVVSPFEQEQAPIEETVVEEVMPIVEENTDFAVAPIEETIQTVPEVTPTEEIQVSDVKAKYNELSNNIRSLIGNEKEDGYIDIVGSNTDTSHVEYRFTEEEDIVEVTRTESNKQTGEENSNTIAFVSELDEGKIQVYLDDTLLFEEQELIEDPKKKMQVMEKFNKFIFLTGEKLKDFEKARKAQEAELQEKRRLQDIFRNF